MKKHILFAFSLFLLSILPAWKIAEASERERQFRKRLQHAASHDGLTGLPNRVLYLDRLEQAIREAKRYNRCFALLYIDLDGFKNVNDTLGHDAGDQLLIETARNLRQCVRQADTVARLGGDEFSIILSSIHTVDDAKKVAEKVIHTVSLPVLFDSQEARVGASVGISVFPDRGDSAEMLVRKADEAMYCAKESGKGAFFVSE